MINFFTNQKRQVVVQGKGQESIFLTRQGRSSSLFKLNNVFMGLLEDNSQIDSGDIIIDNKDKYLVVGIRHTYRTSQVQLYKANAEIEIVRIAKHFTKGTHDGFVEEPVTILPSFHQTITANMKQFDAGLLPNTVRRFYVPCCDIQLLDRIKIEDNKYQVNVVDDTGRTGSTGLLSIQCSLDKRIVK